MKFYLASILFSTLAWASSEDAARLEIRSAGERLVQSAVLEPVEPIADPLICRRVANRLEHLQRIDRQLLALLDKMIKSPEKFSDADQAEKENLEMKRQESYDFLAQPAPAMRMVWSLEELDAAFIERLYLGNVRFKLESYAAIWEGSGETFEMPEQVGRLWVSKVERRLTLVLKGKLVEFCSRSGIRLTFVEL